MTITVGPHSRPSGPSGREQYLRSMIEIPVYLDNHSTTRVDPRVLEAMLPYYCEQYGNSGSTSHVFGWNARDAVEQARQTIASQIGATSREIVFTSGATESNNLAIRGVAERRRRKGNHLISVKTEHKAVLDPLTKLSHREYEVTLVPVAPHSSSQAGLLDVDRIAEAIRDDTLMVSVMLANNEIGVIQPIAELGAICSERGVLLHTDATQAVGKLPVDVQQLQVDLMSFSAHKLHGPKGVGALFVRRRGRQVRLNSQQDGGAQENGLRSGTLNVPGIVGLATAVDLACQELDTEPERQRHLRDRLFQGLRETLDGVTLNGPDLSLADLRLAGNLNCSFAWVDGEALMMSMREIAVSSGSACTSANPEPSHVLRAMELDADLVRSSLRFGLGRFNTQEEIDFAVGVVAEGVTRLRKMSSMS
jgi:cysteine desulfurase